MGCRTGTIIVNQRQKLDLQANTVKLDMVDSNNDECRGAAAAVHLVVTGGTEGTASGRTNGIGRHGAHGRTKGHREGTLYGS